MAFYNTFMYFRSVFQMRRSYALCKNEISTVDFITCTHGYGCVIFVTFSDTHSLLMAALCSPSI